MINHPASLGYPPFIVVTIIIATYLLIYYCLSIYCLLFHYFIICPVSFMIHGLPRYMPIYGFGSHGLPPFGKLLYFAN